MGEFTCHTWTIEEGKAGFILEARLYSYIEGAPLSVDNLTVNVSGGSIIFQDVNIISGYADSSKHNYDSETFKDDGSYLYDDCNGECGGDAVEDCAGECGGAAEFDICGICDGN